MADFIIPNPYNWPIRIPLGGGGGGGFYQTIEDNAGVGNIEF